MNFFFLKVKSGAAQEQTLTYPALKLRLRENRCTHVYSGPVFKICVWYEQLYRYYSMCCLDQIIYFFLHWKSQNFFFCNDFIQRGCILSWYTVADPGFPVWGKNLDPLVGGGGRAPGTPWTWLKLQQTSYPDLDLVFLKCSLANISSVKGENVTWTVLVLNDLKWYLDGGGSIFVKFPQGSSIHKSIIWNYMKRDSQTQK